MKYQPDHQIDKKPYKEDLEEHLTTNYSLVDIFDTLRV